MRPIFNNSRFQSLSKRTGHIAACFAPALWLFMSACGGGQQPPPFTPVSQMPPFMQTPDVSQALAQIQASLQECQGSIIQQVMAAQSPSATPMSPQFPTLIPGVTPPPPAPVIQPSVVPPGLASGGGYTTGNCPNDITVALQALEAAKVNNPQQPYAITYPTIMSNVYALAANTISSAAASLPPDAQMAAMQMAMGLYQNSVQGQLGAFGTQIASYIPAGAAVSAAVPYSSAASPYGYASASPYGTSPYGYTASPYGVPYGARTASITASTFGPPVVAASPYGVPGATLGTAGNLGISPTIAARSVLNAPDLAMKPSSSVGTHALKMAPSDPAAPNLHLVY